MPSAPPTRTDARHTRADSLRARLALLVIAAALPVVALLVVDGLEGRQRAIGAAQADLLLQAQLAANTYNQSIAGVERMLATLALHPALQEAARTGQAGSCTAALQAAHAGVSDALGFGLWTPDGRLICSQSGNVTAATAAERLWFQAAVATRQFAIGEFQLTSARQLPTLAFGYPLLDETGAVRAVLSTAWDLEAIERAGLAVEIPPDAVIVILDHEGTVLARRPETASDVGERLPARTIPPDLLARGQAIVERQGVDGVLRIYAYTVVASPGATPIILSIGREPAVLYAQVNQGVTRDLLGPSLVLLTAAAAVWIGTERLVLRRVDQLVALTRRLAGGDLGARAATRPEAHELGQLARAFSDMAAALEARATERRLAEEQLRRLQAATEALSGAVTPAEVLAVIHRHCTQALGATSSAVYMLNPENTQLILAENEGMADEIRLAFPNLPLDAPLMAPEAMRTGQPVWVESLAQYQRQYPQGAEALAQTGAEAVAAVPLWAEAQRLGVLVVAFAQARQFSTDTQTFILTLSSHCAQALDRARLYAQLDQRVRQRTADLQALNVSLQKEAAERELAQARLAETNRELSDLAARMELAREEERRRLARELHDQLGGALTGLKLDLARLRDALPAAPPAAGEAAAVANSLSAALDETIDLVRRLATELRPAILDDLGLYAALDWLVKDFANRSNIRCRLGLPDEDLPLGPEVTVAIFRLCQESLTNVARHAAASAVHVDLSCEDEQVVLCVQDNGRGFVVDEAAARKSLGLAGMRERVRAVAGVLLISSTPGQGTVVVIRIPIGGSG